MYVCDSCGGLLDVHHDLDALKPTVTRALFESRLGALDAPYNSGVWRYKELIYPDISDDMIVSRPEGNTNLYRQASLAAWCGVDTLYLKHEGENPTGSFKDRGMTGGLTQARRLGMQRVACASTGNTSASLAAYAAFAGLEGIVFFQNKQVAVGKLAQAVAYGATGVPTKEKECGEHNRHVESPACCSTSKFSRHLSCKLIGGRELLYDLLQTLGSRVLFGVTNSPERPFTI